MNSKNSKNNFSKILFLCVANSARSQMAEALAKNILPKTLDIQSAGSRPGSDVHAMAIQTVIEFNPEISKARPKSIASLPEHFLDQHCLVIRLCAEEECPLVSPEVEVRDWSLPDPANPQDEDLSLAFIKTRKLLTEKLHELKKELTE